ncbi:MAG TPA: CBS domain-containing protein [Bryobacteraceae bacterium]|nr:CBS domain-containing protein [Bryobacteraceae bacterium]
MASQKIVERENKRESGLPGGGAGRKDQVGGSGVYPMSGPHPAGNAPIVTPAAWGQGKRGAEGYEDHGESELSIISVKPEKCRDLMTKDPVCCLPSDTASYAAQLMARDDIGAVPVVADRESKKLLAMITDRDLAISVVAQGRDPQSVRIEEIMSSDLVSCSPDDACSKALTLMEEHKIRRIPAVDQTGRIVGIISQSDVALRMHDAENTSELVLEVSRPN